MHELDALPVPDFDFAAIKQRAQRPRRIGRRVFTATVLAIAVPALAFAALQFVPFSVTHKYGMWQVYAPRRTSVFYRNPTQSTLATVAKRARYRVVWPAQMPQSNTLEALDDDSSQMFTLVYRCPQSLRGYTAAVIIPQNYAAISPQLGKWFFSQSIPGGRIVKWRVRNQLMLLESTCLTMEELEHVRAATNSAGAAQP